MLSRQGFLSPELAQHVPQIRAAHTRLFTIAERANEIMATTVSSGRVDASNHRRHCAAALFLRSLELFETVVLLLERGMVPPARLDSSVISWPKELRATRQFS